MSDNDDNTSTLSDHSIINSTPSANPTEFFNRNTDPNDTPKGVDCAHDRRARYERRTGRKRDRTPEGMKSTKTPPPSPIPETVPENS